MVVGVLVMIGLVIIAVMMLAVGTWVRMFLVHRCFPLFRLP